MAEPARVLINAPTQKQNKKGDAPGFPERIPR